jgi:hypothetical protein
MTGAVIYSVPSDISVVLCMTTINIQGVILKSEMRKMNFEIHF